MIEVFSKIRQIFPKGNAKVPQNRNLVVSSVWPDVLDENTPKFYKTAQRVQKFPHFGLLQGIIIKEPNYGQKGASHYLT